MLIENEKVNVVVFFSVCPELLLLALEKRDYLLAQLCLQAFPDVPEYITCCCLKTFLR